MSLSAKQNDFLINAAAAVRDYRVEPQLEYKTIAGVQGPLVILENVKSAKYAEIVKVKEFYHDGEDCDSELEDLSPEEKKNVLLKRL
jgi:hypothetical protein